MKDKEFDNWSTIKKGIHKHRKSKWCKEGEVWWCQIGINVGYEQDGTNENFERPVVILKTLGHSSCLIVPLTTSGKKNLFYLDIGKIDNKNAQAIISQIRLIDTRRMEERICKLDIDVLSKIKKSIQTLFE